MQTMQMVPPDDQMLNQSKLCHLVVKFATNASGAIWWPNFQLMQEALAGVQNNVFLELNPKQPTHPYNLGLKDKKTIIQKDK